MEQTLLLSKLYESYGYIRFKMSKFEEYDTYVKNKSFLTSDNIITFTDTNGKLMALKPDVTLSIVKNSKDEEGYARKVYYNENVYRVSADSNSFKEIMQSGLECIGDVDKYEIAEVLRIARESLSLFSDEYVLDVSHLGIIAAAVDACGLDEKGKNKLLDCFGKKNISDAETIMQDGNVPAICADEVVKLMSCCGKPSDVLPELEKTQNEKIRACVEELKEILALADSGVRIDFSVINDMRYYNGIVFQGFVKNVPKCVLSGGQYDALLKKMRRHSRAIGFAIYLDEIKEETVEAPEANVLVLFNKDSDIKKVAEKVKEIRAAGKNAVAQKVMPENVVFAEIIRV